MKARILLIVSIFALEACTSGFVSLNVPDTKKEKPEGSKMELIEKQECGFQLFDFIPANTNEQLSKAMRSITFRATGTYVEDIAVDQTWYYGFVGTVLCTTVTARIYR